MIDTAALYLGIDLGGTKIEAQLLDKTGHCIWRHRIATPALTDDRDQCYQAVLQRINTLVNEARDIAAGRAICIGLAAPGSQVPGSDIMQNCNSTSLNGRRLQHDLQQLVGAPIRLANDADCMLLSEVFDGAAADVYTRRDTSTAVFGVILGTGVGGAIAVDRQLLSGPNGIMGEWGHNRVPTLAGHNMGRDCYCGGTDCIETHLSGVGLATTYRLQAPKGEALLDARAIASGDSALCLQVMDQYYEMLAACLAGVINIIDPAKIVFAGGTSRLPNLVTELEQRIGRYVFSRQLRTGFVLSQHGDASGARGAAWLWRDRRHKT